MAKKSKTLLRTSKPIFNAKGDALEFLTKTPKGNIILLRPDAEFAVTVDRFGNGDYGQIAFNLEPEVTEFVTLYPNGQAYTKSCCPVSQSSYDIEGELIQIKVTRRGGKIVRKEFC